MDDGKPRVTVVVVPRERFLMSEPSLESIVRHTPEDHELVYVDGNSPARVRKYLERRSRDLGFRLIRTERYLSPNEARNIALRAVETPYVAFVDNDLIVTPGWLGTMLDTAERTGAWVVGPMYLEGDPADRIIHMAGGDMELSGPEPHARFTTEHRLQGVAMQDLERPLLAEPCGFVEFHCMLVRTSVFDELGPLDEGLRNTREHLDLCLGVRAAGGEVWFEPAAEVTYSTPPPLPPSDIPYFLLRWSESWTDQSLRHFCAKHGIDPAYAKRATIIRARRQIVFQPARRMTRRLLGDRSDAALGRTLAAVEHRLNRALVRAS